MSKTASISKIHWAFVALAYLTLLSLSLIDNARGPAYPDILSTLSLNATRGSQLFAWASLAGLLANLSARWWLSFFSLAQSTVASLLLMAIGSYLFAQSAQVGAWLLDLSSFLMGLGMGAANVSMNLLIAKGVPELHRRRFYAGLHSVYGLGSLSAPLLLSAYYTLDPSWEGFFKWIIILPLSTVAILWLKRNHFKDQGPSSADAPKTKLTAPVGWIRRLALGLIFGFYVASEIVVSSRLVLYFQEAHNFSANDARLALSCFFLALLFGRLLFALLPTKGSSINWLIFSCLSTITVYILSQVVHPAFLVLSGLTMSYFYPVAMDWLSKQFTQGFEWMSASVLTTISVMLVMMHMSFGMISDWMGIELAMALVPALQSLCLLILVVVGKKE